LKSKEACKLVLDCERWNLKLKDAPELVPGCERWSLKSIYACTLVLNFKFHCSRSVTSLDFNFKFDLLQPRCSLQASIDFEYLLSKSRTGLNAYTTSNSTFHGQELAYKPISTSGFTLQRSKTSLQASFDFRYPLSTARTT
jgi:hypothetical protein